MFNTCYSLTAFNVDLPSLTDGYQMFNHCHELESFTSDLPSLTDGQYMFSSCYVLSAFNVDLPSLTKGDNMFMDCRYLTSFNADLPSLLYGGSMFRGCYELTAFNVDLPSLTSASNMFYKCIELESFSSDMSSVLSCYLTFANCNKLTTFTSNMPKLDYASGMFENCSNLTSFTSDLPSLLYGDKMFYYCKLDATSVKNIIDTINTVSGRYLTLGMGCNNTTEDKDLFAQEVGYADMTSLLAALQSKGWIVTAQYNGRPTTTYSLRRPSEDTLPVFVKLEEVEEEVVEYADYTSLDDSKKYRLYYFHETTGSTDGYTQFNSLEEAIESLNIKPIENQ